MEVEADHDLMNTDPNSNSNATCITEKSDGNDERAAYDATASSSVTLANIEDVISYTEQPCPIIGPESEVEGKIEEEKDVGMLNLNQQQLEVVRHRGSPLLVFAAAGTGKTQALTARIAHLVRYDGVPPLRIMALTFTRKAAAEMRKRAAEKCGCSERQLMNVGTFHSACIRLLRRLGSEEAVGGSDFSVIDPKEAFKLMDQQCLPLAKLNVGVIESDKARSRYDVDVVFKRIEAWRNDCLEPEDVDKDAEAYDASSELDRLSLEAYKLYRQACLAQGVVDFGDLILHTVRMLDRNPRIRAFCQARLFAHLLVDEFQDTNPAQMRLVELLCGHDFRVDAHVVEEEKETDKEAKEEEEDEAEEEKDNGEQGEGEEEDDDGSLLSGDDEYVCQNITEDSDTDCEVSDDDDDEEDRVRYRVRKGGRLGEDRLMVVGDDYQAIHEWRGATVKNIMEFTENFPASRTVHLELNYRSRPFILEAAGRLISRNASQHHKLLIATRDHFEIDEDEDSFKVRRDFDADDVCIHADAIEKENVNEKENIQGKCGNSIRFIEHTDETDEARQVARIIKTEGFRPGDVVVLYRTNAQSQPFEQAFRSTGIPYEIKGATSFFSRVEVRDCLAFAKFVANPRSDADLLRVINNPTRGIGKAVQDQLTALKSTVDEQGNKKFKGVWDVMRHVAKEVSSDAEAATRSRRSNSNRSNSQKGKGKTDGGVMSSFTPRGAKHVAEFVEVMEVCLSQAHVSEASEALRFCLERSSYMPRLREQIQSQRGGCETTKADAEARMLNVEAVLNIAASYPLQHGERRRTIASFADHCMVDVDEESENERKRREEDVSASSGGGEENRSIGKAILMTLHASKGLEFPVVFMVGVYEGMLPYYRAVKDNKIEEERRLCYVGVTRARDLLAISFPRKRFLFGKSTSTDQSRFVSELRRNN
jgi:superfamily I DNA/RNA helicase